MKALILPACCGDALLKLSKEALGKVLQACILYQSGMAVPEMREESRLMCLILRRAFETREERRGCVSSCRAGQDMGKAAAAKIFLPEAENRLPQAEENVPMANMMVSLEEYSMPQADGITLPAPGKRKRSSRRNGACMHKG